MTNSEKARVYRIEAMMHRFFSLYESHNTDLAKAMNTGIKCSFAALSA